MGVWLGFRKVIRRLFFLVWNSVVVEVLWYVVWFVGSYWRLIFIVRG